MIPHSLSVFLMNQPSGWAFNLLTGGLLYLGPNTVLPIATTLATVIGFILIFWRLILKGVTKPFRFVYSKITHKPFETPEVDPAAVDNPDDHPTL